MNLFLRLCAVSALACALAGPAIAQTTGGGVIAVGALFGPIVQPYIDALIGALLSALLAWVLFVVKQKLNVSIDDSMRDSLHTWLARQASSLVAAGAVRVSGLQVNVGSAALADVATKAIKEIPDTVAHFGITPEKLAEMVVDKIPAVPTVSAMVAVQGSASAAVAADPAAVVTRSTAAGAVIGPMPPPLNAGRFK